MNKINEHITLTRKNSQAGYNSCDSEEGSVFCILPNFVQKQYPPTYLGYYSYTPTEIRTTGCKFPGSQNVNYKTAKAGFWLTRSHLVKNDLNGHFLTDQPGQPFNGDPGIKAGLVVVIYLIDNLMVQNGNGTKYKPIYSFDILMFTLLAKLLANEFNFKF